MLLLVLPLSCVAAWLLGGVGGSPNRVHARTLASGDDVANFETCNRYPCWPSARVEALDGYWDFAFLSNISDPTAIDVTKVHFDDTMAVPASFDASPRYAGMRGTAVYRTMVYVNDVAGWRLKFEACSLWCAVYVDGKMITEHSNGYSPFWVGDTPNVSGKHEVIVVADNRFDDARTILQKPGYDFYQYGGIIRTVTLHEHAYDISIQGVDVMTGLDTLSDVAARVRFHAPAGFPSTVSLSYAIDNQVVGTTEYSVEQGQVVIPKIQVPNASLWSPSHPTFHYLYVAVAVGSIRATQDAIIVRFGLRTVAPCKRRSGEMTLCINNNETKLLGFSRHDAHPQFGATLNRQQWMQDLQILKDMGGNYLRLVHYPHDPEFLSLCDEMGVLVWQENLGWGNSASDLTNPTFIKALIKGLDEMVNNTFNHPSIILWAFLNEGASNDKDACRDAYQVQVARYKELKVNGLVTWASNKAERDVCLDHADVVSFNSYPGWYGDSSDYNLEDQLATVAPKIISEASWAAADQNKPFIKSEIGAGAIPEWEDTFNGFWTADYQGSLLSIVAKTVKENANFTGVSLWQFFDVRTYNGPHALGRPRALNNKGILDEYRRPKRPSFDAVRAIFKGDALNNQCARRV